jgi:hypothetical protein
MFLSAMNAFARVQVQVGALQFGAQGVAIES